jgi:hypothetical protein
MARTPPHGDGKSAVSARPQSWTRYLREVTRFDQFKLLELIAEASCDHLRRTDAAAELGKQWQPANSLHAFAMARVARDVILDGFATATTLRPSKPSSTLRTSRTKRRCANRGSDVSTPATRSVGTGRQIRLTELPLILRTGWLR